MSKCDVEMEDAELHSNDSGNNVQESKIKVLDADVESKGEKFSCAAAVSGDVHEKENGGEDINKCRNEDKDSTKDETEVKDQTDPKSEAKEEGCIREQISTNSENEELINTKTKAEEPTAPRSAVEKQTDAKDEVVEQNTANGGVKEENFPENGTESVNHVKNVKEKPNEDVGERKSNGIGNENQDEVEQVSVGEKTMENADGEKTTENANAGNRQLPANEAPQRQKVELEEVRQSEDEEMEDAVNLDKDKTVKDDLVEQSAETVLPHRETDGNEKTAQIAAKHDGEDSLLANQHEAATPDSIVRYSSSNAGDHSGETFKTVFTQATLPLMGEDDDGTLEEQTTFMKEIESFYREKAMDFKPPKFYGQPLNCLKLWRAVIRLGGYDRVTGSKLWRQVGESFHPPKTCTTVSWTFRIFYEKALLEFERHKTQSGELQLPVPTLPEAFGVDGEGSGYQGSGSGRARRDSAARAMQGWHVQRLSAHGEVGEPIIKDKNLNNMAKREKNLKSIGSLKQKRPNELDHSNKVARIETSKQLVASVVDVGPPADWVKINVRQTKDCFEVYALVPGLLREEVRVQSDPAGRLVITGLPEHVDNPWGITAFKKVVSLPARIDPLQTSAVVSLHGRLFVRVPFEQ
ncbi:hypothetical protein DH2020_049443 [Rehmannia glutinosa]|uniref:AT-rich interactive domain-containing protein n=1 Tax=Rehmannia glutinosa TaxID=99300 RepID=A0ABR0U2T2_REHGL